MESEFNARSQLRGVGSAGGWGMEKFRPPVPRAAAARKHQANGCSRVGREKPASRPLEMRPPTMVWLVTSVREQQEQGCSTREDKPGATPAQVVTLLIRVQSSVPEQRQRRDWR